MSSESSEAQPAALIAGIKRQLAEVEANGSGTPRPTEEWLGPIRTELERLERWAGEVALSEADRRSLIKELDRLWRRLLVGPLPPSGVNGSGLTPEFLERARQQYSEEEIAAVLREMYEHGGYELHEFIHELEQAAGPDE